MDKFYDAVSGYISYVAYKYLIDKSYVDDVIINTVSKIINNIQKYDDTKNSLAWIYTIAKNETYRINEREKRQTHISLEEVEQVACISESIDSAEFLLDLDRIIKKLGPKDAQIVELRVFSGLTFREIAEELHMYPGTVAKHYKNALDIILKKLF